MRVRLVSFGLAALAACSGGDHTPDGSVAGDGPPLDGPRRDGAGEDAARDAATVVPDGSRDAAGVPGGCARGPLAWSPASAGVGDYATYPKVAITAGTRNYRGYGTDVWLELPAGEPWEAPASGGLVIQGYRNVVLIGGEVFLPDSIPYEETPRRAIYLVDLTGVVFLEGLHVHGPGVGDVFTINSPNATFYLQHIRAEISHAGEQADVVHADLVQPWGGHAGLHFDRFTGLSTYQGFQINRSLADVGPVQVSRTNLRNNPDGGSTANYLLWMDDVMDPVRVAGDTFWLDPAPDRPSPALVHSIWPASCELATDALGSYATCPDLRNGSGALVLQDVATGEPGRVREGLPVDGDCVRADEVGVGYVSPGYLP